MNKINFPLKPQTTSSEVLDLHQALTLLGFEVTETEKAKQSFGPSTAAAVRRFQSENRLATTGVVNQPTADLLNRLLIERGVLDGPTQPGSGNGGEPPANPPEQKLHIVEGEVVEVDGKPLANYLVQAFDRSLSVWRELNEEVRTNDLGRYRITYDPVKLKEWGKTHADLKVEVYSPSDKALRASSPLMLQARPKEKLDFVIGKVSYRGPDEYSRVHKALSPRLEPINDLGSLELSDIIILARDTDLSNSSVAQYIKAQRWAMDLSFAPEVFYGLLRRHQPARLDALFAQPLAHLWARLQQAKEKNLIALPLDDQLRSRLGEVQQSYLAQPNHPYAQLLGTTGLNGEQIAVFTKRMTAGTETGEVFWKSLQADAGFTSAQVSELKATFEVQSFSGNNTTLAIQLRGPMKVREPRDVATFSFEDWRDKALAGSSVLVPYDILPGKEESVRREAYAHALYQSAQITYPTTCLMAQMDRSQTWSKQPVVTFLKAHPDFEFDSQRVTNFLKENPKALDAFPDPDTVRQELLRFEQLVHLTQPIDRLKAIEPLWQAGLRSAPRIAAAGRRKLLRQVGNQLDKSAVNAIYRKAVHLTAVALNIYLRYSPSLNRLSLPMMRTRQFQQEVPIQKDISQLQSEQMLARAATELPEWTELFGSADACECSYCESTLSPAAYFVDMLDFLSRADDGNNKTALDYLLERRPDLGLIELTCENTETEVKQIDLVIEIMEQIVAFSSDGTTIPTGHVGQTTWDSELLAAHPENLEPAAYEKLRSAVFPFDRLPFDLWLEEGRRYLKQMGITRDELMRVMPPRTGVGASEIAAEALQMSTAEQKIIANPDMRAPSLAVLWGVDPSRGSTVKQLTKVKELLDRARIDYHALLRLLNTRYLNPDGVLTVAFAGESCSLDRAQLARADGTALADAIVLKFFDQLHRFLRLQRKLGWNEYELDSAIQALGVKDFNDRDFFPRLAAVQALRATFQLSVSEVCSWWGDLNGYRFEDALLSQYEEIFLDPSVYPDTHSGIGVDLRNNVFALTVDRRDLAVTKSTDVDVTRWLAEMDGATPPTLSLKQDYSAYIQSAARLTADDILVLVSDVLPKDPVTKNVALNLANVSLLYRIGSFARALQISVKDYLRLIRLTRLAPLTVPGRSASPLTTQELKTRFDEINGGELSLEQLAYLLLHETEAAVTLGPKTEEMDALLAQLSPAYVGIGIAGANPELTSSLTQSLGSTLGSTLGLDAELLNELLFTLRKDLGQDLIANLIVAANPVMPSPPSASRSFYEVFETLHKFAIAWNAFGLDATHLSFVVNKNPDLPDIAGLPLTEVLTTDFEKWRRLTNIAGLQLSLFSVEESLFALSNSAQTHSREAFLAQASESTGWSLTDVTYLTGPEGFNYAYPAVFQKPDWLIALQDIFSTLLPLGVSAEQAQSWIGAELTSGETESIKQVLTLSYDKDRWLEVMTGIQDELRTIRRDALLGYMLNRLGSSDSNDFYRHYLIDPEMAPLALSSRIVEAHAAVQLFGQRILLNLEQPLAFSREDAEAWQWRKNYRVWEAARKVFLYPENWMEPELRDDKSIFFQELEDGLMQDEVTLESAERLYGDYLRKLDQVSRLEIMGMYEDKWMDGDVERKVLHIFGRTRDIAGLFYYRRWEDGSRWTSWERVEVDIHGEHLIPVVYNGRLYLFWPEFKETRNEVDASQTGSSTASAEQALKDDIDDLQVARSGVKKSLQDDFGIPVVNEDLANNLLSNHNIDEDLRQLLESWLSFNSQITSKNNELDELEEAAAKAEATAPKLYETELGMCWSQYHAGTWSAKTIGTERWTYGTNSPISKHFFSGWVSDDNRLCIGVHTVTGERLADGDGPVESNVGYFYFNECQGNLLFSSVETTSPQGQSYLYGSYQRYQYWDSFIAETLSMDVTENNQTTNRMILETVPQGSVVVHFAHQYGLGGSVTSPFFVTDPSRTYFVRVDNVFSSPFLSGGFLSDRTLNGVGSRAVAPGTSLLPATVTGNHYGGFSNAIVSRNNGLDVVSVSHQQSDFLIDVISADPSPQFIPNSASVETSVKTSPRYVFTRFYHPYTGLFFRQLSRRGADGLLNPDPEWDEDSENLYRQLTPLEDFNFEDTYSPTSEWVQGNFSDEAIDEKIDFDHDSPYGVYNWELFFHIPLLIATRLMQNQRFAEARRWFQYIFDPTYADGRAAARFWKVKPLYQEQLKGPTDTLNEMIALLAQGDTAMEEQVQVLESEPFQPYAIARLRPVAFMQTTVLKYLDCLIAEADMLFTMDTREHINEAAQLYLLAAEILGEKPTLIPAQETETKTPNALLGRFKIDLNINLFDPLDGLTSLFPTGLSGVGFSRSKSVGGSSITVNAQGALTNYNTLLLFGIPHNEKLYAYWDTLADRLFKIRHSMNITGQVRQIPLFAPPIDPALLVRATAAGLDIASIISNLYAPLPNYRFGFMLQKALEFCGEVRNLGGALQAALEKQDGEELALLRSAHETSLLEAIKEVKTRTLEEAEASLESLNKSRESTELRLEYYSSRERISSREQASLNLQETGRHRQFGAEIAETTASVLLMKPDMTATVDFPPSVSATFGGTNLGGAAQATASYMRAKAASFAYQANKASIMAGYVRREDDWKHQADLAKKELEQLDKQIIAAEIRQQIAQKDLENHEQQITQSAEVEEFLKLKFSSQQLYSWMCSKLSTLYFQAYQMAYQLAKQTEKSFQHELGPNEKSQIYIQPTYWDNLKKGLLAGEQLSLDLRRMETAHLEANNRELEITKHISLCHLDPSASLRLRETGVCEFDIPEVLYDMDFPGHYFRRIKAARLTIPCVVGPYTNVTGTLSLTASRIRRDTTYPLPVLAPEGTVLPQTAIATSSAREDGGVFELTFNDPRYLPFEGAGAVSSWKLELPAVVRPFDYDTIADVIIHLSYTARDGGAQFKNEINLELSDLNTAMRNSGLVLSRIFSIRKEFSGEWNRLLYPAEGVPQQTSLTLTKQHFPRYLDYLWEENGESWEPQPIELRISSVNASLSPKGPVSPEDQSIQLSVGLSGMVISNEAGVDLNLTVTSGEVTPDKWKDIYVLMTYEAAV